MNGRFLLSLLTIVAVGAILVAGCATTPSSSGSNATTAPSLNETRTITDMYGHQVTVPATPHRVGIFGGPIGMVPFMLGVQDTLVAVTKGHKSELLVKIYPPLKDLPAPRAQNGQINIEELLASNPEFVIAGDVDGAIVEKQTRIPVVYFMSDADGTFNDTKNEVLFLGQLFNRTNKAEHFASYLDTTVDLVKNRTGDIPADKRLKVFKGYDTTHLVTYGGDSYMNERIEAAGCINVAGPISTKGQKEGLHSGLDQVSREQVLAWNPDIIVIDTGSPQDLYDDPQWAGIAAVKNHRVYRQPSGLFVWNRPSAESAVLFPIWLATVAYPDRFTDIDMKQEVKRFYAEIFEYDLSDEDAEKVLSGGFSQSSIFGGAAQGNVSAKNGTASGTPTA